MYSNAEFDVEAIISESLNIDEDDFAVINTLVGKELYKDNYIDVEIYAKEYGGSDEKPAIVRLTWQLVLGTTENLKFKQNSFTVKGEDSLSANAIKNYITNNEVIAIGYDKSKVSYQYSYNYTGSYDEETASQNLDKRYNGVPTEEGNYYVYLRYNDTDIDVAFVNIDKSIYKFAFEKKQHDPDHHKRADRHTPQASRTSLHHHCRDAHTPRRGCRGQFPRNGPVPSGSSRKGCQDPVLEQMVRNA